MNEDPRAFQNNIQGSAPVSESLGTSQQSWYCNTSIKRDINTKRIFRHEDYMARKHERRQGGTLGRSETVTVRLDPKLNYLCELAARSQRRTKSSLIEAALVGALNSIPVDPRPSDQPPQSIAQLAEILWDVDEVSRFQRLAHSAPHLMTFEEQQIWSTLVKHPHYWIGEWTPLDEFQLHYQFVQLPENLWLDRVRNDWELIKSVAAGRTDDKKLPKMDVVIARNPQIQEFMDSILGKAE
jgi:hypothetical protein